MVPRNRALQGSPRGSSVCTTPQQQAAIILQRSSTGVHPLLLLHRVSGTYCITVIITTTRYSCKHKMGYIRSTRTRSEFANSQQIPLRAVRQSSFWWKRRKGGVRAGRGGGCGLVFAADPHRRSAQGDAAYKQQYFITKVFLFSLCRRLSAVFMVRLELPAGVGALCPNVQYVHTTGLGKLWHDKIGCFVQALSWVDGPGRAWPGRPDLEIVMDRARPGRTCQKGDGQGPGRAGPGRAVLI